RTQSLVHHALLSDLPQDTALRTGPTGPGRRWRVGSGSRNTGTTGSGLQRDPERGARSKAESIREVSLLQPLRERETVGAARTSYPLRAPASRAFEHPPRLSHRKVG